MNSKNVKVVDEHNIDRDASVIFAYDLEGSEYVTYWVERDETQNNIFVSKIIKNLDGTFNLLDIDDSMEKDKISDIVKSLIITAVNSANDKLVGDTVTLSDGKVIKLMSVSFNKEQRINVKKSYVTTVKKEVTKVASEYYDVVVSVETAKLSDDDIFPSVMPVMPEQKVSAPEPSVTSEISLLDPVMEPITQTVSIPEAPVLSTPSVEVVKEESKEDFVAFGTDSTVPSTTTIPQMTPVVDNVVVQPTPVVVEPVVEPTPVVEPQPSVVESITNVPPVVEHLVVPEAPKPVEPVTIQVAPVPEVVTPVNEVSQPLMFSMDKETNLKKALGEVANSQTIPVENIQPVREFGVDEPVKVVSSLPQPEVSTVQPEVASAPTTNKAGFANSKFFMVVAIAFFLASCVFLGYEVFHYFQLTK